MKTFLVLASLVPFYAIPAALVALIALASGATFAAMNYILRRRLPVATATPEAIQVGIVVDVSFTWEASTTDASNASGYPATELVPQAKEVLIARAANKPVKTSLHATLAAAKAADE